MPKLDPAQEALRMDLYKAGKFDTEIARIVGVHTVTIECWRKRRGLPPNFAFDRSTFELREKMYRAGAIDRVIAVACGATVFAIREWRVARNLPAHGTVQLNKAGHARRMLLYQLGWNDGQIAADWGCTSGAVHRWRFRLGLPSNVKSGMGNVRRAPPNLQSVFARIRRAVGRALPRDIADDAVADMCAALLEGTLPLAGIETAARTYGNRVLDRFANKFVQRSLDQELGDDDGSTLMDTLVDERSSSWLEEMGATVW